MTNLSFNSNAMLINRSSINQELNNSFNNSLNKRIVKINNCSQYDSQIKNIKKTLSIYNIDVSEKLYSKLNEKINNQKITVFACKKNKQFITESGAYISDGKSGDNYGQFFFYSGRGMLKYQSTKCHHVQIDKKTLNRLHNHYHNVTVTGFLKELLECNPCEAFEIYRKKPQYFYFCPSFNEKTNGFLIYPNLPYINAVDYLEQDTVLLKDFKEGIILGAWAVHPNQNISFIEKLDLDNAMRMKHYFNDKEISDERSVSEIENGTGVKYLSSILDLDKYDVPMLRDLQTNCIKHLKEVYNVNVNKDKIKMFFHFPVATKTATLHLHIWVNRGDHPLNKARSFELEELIAKLADGQTIQDIILKRNNSNFYLPKGDSILKIEGITDLGEVDNPYLLDIDEE